MSMPFKEMMKELVDGVPGSKGAIFVDWEGESVDNYTVEGDDYQLKVVGAYKGVILNLLNEAHNPSENGEIRCVTIRMENFNILLSPVKEGYHVVLVVAKATVLSRAAFRMKKIVRDLMDEM